VTRKKRYRVNYREGTWFLVPLAAGEFAVGVVARMDGRGCVLGYFFEFRDAATASVAEFYQLTRDKSILVALFGDLGLVTGEWTIVGVAQTWDRNAWPIPAFVYFDPVNGKPRKRIYTEELQLPREEPCHLVEANRLPKDGLYGSGAIEIVLGRLIGKGGAETGRKRLP
jgi:hypothetical protein